MTGFAGSWFQYKEDMISDALRQTSVVAKEAGGITQHVGAFVIGMSTGGIKFNFHNCEFYHRTSLFFFVQLRNFVIVLRKNNCQGAYLFPCSYSELGLSSLISFGFRN